MDKDDLDFSDISPEVRERYSFPSQETLQKFKDGAILESKEELNKSQSLFKRFQQLLHTVRDVCIMGASTFLSIATYIQMRTPGGDVTRALYEQSLSPLKRVTRRTLPFIFAVIPLVIFRSYQHEIRLPFAK